MMKPRKGLVKLLLGSVIAGILIKYAAPQGADPVPLIGQFLRDLFFDQTFNPIHYQFFSVETLLWFIIFLLIALVPFMFSLFSGIWGFFTYLSGFLSGYLMISFLSFSSDFPYLIAGILCLALGIVTALYGEYIR